MRRKALFLIFIAWLSAGSLLAQNAGFFKQLWLEEGLSQSSVISIAQDHQGYMWFGTEDGLNRYDSRRVDHFNYQPFNPYSISGDYISSVFPDSSNRLLVLSSDLINELDLETFKSSPAKIPAPLNDKEVHFHNLWKLKDKLYMATSRGFYGWDRSKQVLEHYTFKDSADLSKKVFVYYLTLVDDRLFATTSNGLYSCTKGKYVFNPFSFASGYLKEKSFALAAKGSWLYFSVSNKIICIDLHTGSSHQFELPTHSPIAALLADNKGHIWAGTAGAGLFKFSQSFNGLNLEKHYTSDIQTKYGLKSNYISCLFQGTKNNEDLIWIGTRDAGVFSFSEVQNVFDLVSYRLPAGSSFSAVVKDAQGEMWVGSLMGVYHIDKSGNPTLVNFGEGSDDGQKTVEALYCDNEGKVWVGVGNGLYQIDKRKNRMIKVLGKVFPEEANVIYKITPADSGKLLMGSDKGLAIFDPHNGNVTVIRELLVDGKMMKLNALGTLFVDSKKNWWLGSLQGLFYVNLKQAENYFITHDPSNKNSLLSNMILDINEDNDHFYIATSKGLSILDKRESVLPFENFYNAPGLTNNFIYGILFDKKGNLWMSTNFGITNFNPYKKTFRTYHASDGIFINEFNSSGFHVAPDGQLLFAGIGGIIGFYPGKLEKNPLPETPVLRSFKVNQQNSDSLLFSRTEGIVELKHNQNDLYFEFATLDFTQSGIKLYYQLEGAQREWIEIGKDQSLTLANLSPGKYKLHVKAVNIEGAESKLPYLMYFTIYPPFWQTIWFVLFSLIVLVAAIYKVYRFNVRRKMLLYREKERVRQEENERVRKAAALDLHDEFGNGLTRIAMLVEMTKLKVEDPEALKLLGVIADNSQRLYNGTKDFIWSINPGNDNLYEILIRVKDFSDELFYGTGINFEMKGLDEELKQYRQTPATGRNITMIFKEALSNIVKHARASNVMLNVYKQGSFWALHLTDDGRGFAAEKNHKGFGLTNMQQRAKRIGALLEVKPRTERGTEVILTLNYFSHE